MELPKDLQSAIDELTKLSEIESILLSGSRGKNGISDSNSDYDLYLYVTQIPVQEVRSAILTPLCQRLELANRYWEEEDDGVFNDGTAFEFIYRNSSEFEKNFDRVVNEFQASVGYSTCFWSNVKNSIVLFDRRGWGKRLIEKAERPFPDSLVKAIVEKNWPILFESSSSFGNQIEKALKRNDWISVQHRTAAFLASYFDILFAVNRLPHPGEKKLVEISRTQLKKLPPQFEKDIDQIGRVLKSDQVYLVPQLKTLTKRLEELLVQENWIESSSAPAGELDFGTTDSPSQEIVVYTDGGCIGNPGKGAWATVIIQGSKRIELCGGDPATTNNKMELKAVIEALRILVEKQEFQGKNVSIYTDSQYVKNGITTWISTWERNGWKTAAKESVKNQELWKELQALDRKVSPQWKWVKGHAGNPENERCDTLVRETMKTIV